MGNDTLAAGLSDIAQVRSALSAVIASMPPEGGAARATIQELADRVAAIEEMVAVAIGAGVDDVGFPDPGADPDDDAVVAASDEDEDEDPATVDGDAVDDGSVEDVPFPAVDATTEATQIVNDFVVDKPDDNTAVAADQADDVDADVDADDGGTVDEFDDAEFPDAGPEPEPEPPALGSADAVMGEPADSAATEVSLPNGTYPIRNLDDLEAVVEQFDDADEADKEPLRAHIKARAAALAAEAAELADLV